ncbi:MAG TPA: lipopolysaccharide assembly protein LapA domain-containing protein [Nocardioidaceae bacterium]|nr:lipopolysaccharide assembly protein LapA domain-containing protein [Nocardioidaceae bacterium]
MSEQGEPARDETATTPRQDPLRGSRTSRVWIAVVGLVVVLLLLIIFIAQNTQSVEVSFLGWEGTPPLAVALLIAAAAGLVLAATAGVLRILQLRRRVRRTTHN